MCHDRPKPNAPSVESASSKNRNAAVPGFSLDFEEIFDANYQSLTPVHYRVDVCFVPQLESWDCGLACAAMALSVVRPRWSSAACPDNLNPPSILSILTNSCSTKSIWTIDLAYLLSRYGVQVAVTTTHVGANPAYHDYTFYAPNLAQDIQRVNLLFEKASDRGIKVFKRSVDATQLRYALSSGRYIVIALVDKTKLCGRSDSVVSASLEPSNGGLIRNACHESNSDSFTGHFILLCGYDSTADVVCIQDPAGKPDSRLPMWQLDRARKTYGTDEDLIFIRIPDPTSP